MSISLGAIIYVALKPVFKIYAILFIGYLLAKFNVVSVETARGISNMVVNAILPCLVFNKIVGNITARDIKEVGVIVLTGILLFAIGCVCSLIVKVVLPVPKKWTMGLVFAGLFPNISDLPIAYVQSLGSGLVFNSDSVNQGVAYCCIFLTTQSFLMMNFGMFRMVGLDFKDTNEDEENLPASSDKSLPISSPPLESSFVANDSAGSSSLNKNIITNDLGNRKKIDTPRDHSTGEAVEESLELESLTESDLASSTNLEGEGPITYSSSDPRRTSKWLFPRSGASSHETDSSISADNLSTAQSGNRASRSSSLATSTYINPNNTVGRVRRRKQSQAIDDVIGEYSVVNRVRTGELDLTRPLTLTADIGQENTILLGETGEEVMDPDSHSLRLVRTVTNKSLSNVDGWFQRHKLGWLQYILINFFRPASLGALLGIICAMIPWVQALFVNTYVHVHDAPDGLPVLNFVMDFTSYIGNACVPLGLLLLGGTIARLRVRSIPKGFLKIAIAMSIFRLAIIPIIGVAWANKVYDMGWITDDISKLVIVITYAMPTATAQVYFTAFFTPLEGPHLQMDCLSVYFLIQYLLLFITLPIVVSYTLKVDLQY